MDYANVFIKNPDSPTWELKGKHGFVSFPRLGEHLKIEQEHILYIYKVVCFSHPLDPRSSQIYTYNAGDIYAVQIGKAEEVLTNLFETT